MSKLSAIQTGGNSLVISRDSSMSSHSQPRASYFIPSNNTSSTFYGATFLDSEFQKISYGTHQTINGNTGQWFSYHGTHETYQNHFNGMTASQSNQDSNSHFVFAGNYAGEFGCALAQGSSRGTLFHSGNRWPTTSMATYVSQNKSYVNSDHAKKDSVLQLRDGNLTVSPLHRPWDGRYSINAMPHSIRKFKNVAPFFTSGSTEITSMQGSASYNNVRKELVIMAHNSAQAGRFDVLIWKNLDLDNINFNIDSLSTPPVVNQVQTPSWFNNTTESRYNMKPVLVDNGNIYYSVFHESNSLSLYEIVRPASDSTAFTSTLMEQQGITTSYGNDQGEGYGQRAVQTRLGNMVATFCPYYYYASGERSFIIDRRNSSWIAGRISNESGSGMHPVKYRDDSFAFVHGGNYYASNWTGMSIRGFASPNPTAGGKAVINTNTVYYPAAPGPDTTNYTNLFHVWDYDLLSIPPAYTEKRN